MSRIPDTGCRSFIRSSFFVPSLGACLVAATLASTVVCAGDSLRSGADCEFGVDRFGERIHALGDQLVVVSSPFADGGAGWCGVLDPWTCELLQSWAGAPGSGLGTAIGHADIDRDGRDDLVISAPGSITGEVRGEVLVHRGLDEGFEQEPSYRLVERVSGESFGVSLLTFDPDGDGWQDLAVGAGTYSGVWSFEGAVHVYRSRASGPDSIPWVTLTGRATAAAFGRALDSADFDGDGRDDLLVGSPEGSWGQNREGRAEIFLGTGGGLSAFPTWSVEGGEPYAYFGFAVGVAALPPGDGRALWAVGAPGVGGTRGRCSVYRGPGFPVAPDIVRSVDEPGAWFGAAIEPVVTSVCTGPVLAVSSPGSGAGNGRVDVVGWDRCDGTYRWGTVMDGTSAGYLGTSLSASPSGLWIGAPWETTSSGRGAMHKWSRPSLTPQDDSLLVLTGPDVPVPAQAPTGPPWTVVLSPQPVRDGAVLSVIGEAHCELEWTSLGADGRKLAGGLLRSGERIRWSEEMSQGARTGWLTFSDGRDRRTIRWVALAHR